MTILLAFKRNKNSVENEKKISKKTELTQGKREACLLSKDPGRQGGSAVGGQQAGTEREPELQRYSENLKK